MSLPDPRKPPLPYKKGLTLTINRHIPPEPCGLGYNEAEGIRQPGSWSIYSELPLTEWCLQSPPQDTPLHPDTTRHTVEIIGEIACEDGRGAQVARCHLDGNTIKTYVAKIYDPLYYEWLPFSEPRDPTFSAESEYSSEATAYAEIEKSGHNGEFTPAYFGSWTFDMPLQGSPTLKRPVRMVLIEWVSGDSLYNLLENEAEEKRNGQEEITFKGVTANMRLDILAKIFEADSKLESAGICQSDLAPRNVMIAELKTETPKVFLIDFGWSIVKSVPHSKINHLKKRDLPVNPRDRFWKKCGEDLQMLAPASHRDTKHFRGWLMTRWGDDPKGFSSYPDWYREKYGFYENFEVVGLE